MCEWHRQRLLRERERKKREGVDIKKQLQCKIINKGIRDRTKNEGSIMKGGKNTKNRKNGKERGDRRDRRIGG